MSVSNDGADHSTRRLGSKDCLLVLACLLSTGCAAFVREAPAPAWPPNAPSALASRGEAIPVQVVFASTGDRSPFDRGWQLLTAREEIRASGVLRPDHDSGLPVLRFHLQQSADANQVSVVLYALTLMLFPAFASLKCEMQLSITPSEGVAPEFTARSDELHVLCLPALLIMPFAHSRGVSAHVFRQLIRDCLRQALESDAAVAAISAHG